MTKYPAKGTQLLMGDGAPTETFTKVVQLHTIGPLSLTKNTASTLDHDSEEYAEEHVETSRDYGEIPFSGHWDPAAATHDESTGLWSKFTGDGPQNFKVNYVEASKQTAAFAASVVGLEIGEATVDRKLEVSGRLKVSGVLDWA